MEARVSVLEHIAQTNAAALERIDRRFDQLERRFDQMAAEHRADFRWLLGIMLAGFGGLLGVMAHGFHWL